MRDPTNRGNLELSPSGAKNMTKNSKTKYPCALGYVLKVLLSIVLISSASAQVGTSTLSGVVTDSTNAALVGATIQVKNVDTNATQSTITDNQGRYRLPDLP